MVNSFILVDQSREGAMNHGSRYSHEKAHRYKTPNVGCLSPARNYNQLTSLFTSVFFIPTSIILLVIVFLLLYNSFNIFFYVAIPTTPLSLFNSTPAANLSQVTPLGASLSTPSRNSSEGDSNLSARKKRRRRRRKKHMVVIPAAAPKKGFSERVKGFFSSPSAPACRPRFFMTWISSLESFSRREVVSMESMFRAHPGACLLMVSASMDSEEGMQTLRPFLERGLRVMAVAPNAEFLFKNTTAAAWFERLKKGRVKPGEISLAQNLSNLLRLALLYKYGGVYMDTDFIILRPLLGLRNAIGAQTSDPRTGAWTRLNNALMVFDKRHPLLRNFIDEFALTFNGNKWGHNGPYLVSRVVKRADPRELNFTVLPPSAFYPVDWGRIGTLFRSTDDHDDEMKRREDKIKRESYGVHLWNRQTRSLKVEIGSVIARFMLDCCLFCNSTSSAFEI